MNILYNKFSEVVGVNEVFCLKYRLHNNGCKLYTSGNNHKSSTNQVPNIRPYYGMSLFDTFNKAYNCLILSTLLYYYKLQFYGKVRHGNLSWQGPKYFDRFSLTCLHISAHRLTILPFYKFVPQWTPDSSYTDRCTFCNCQTNLLLE